MTGIKPSDIIRHKDGFHATVVEPAERGGRKGWVITPIEPWAKTRLFCTAREVRAIYRPLKGSRT